MNRVKETTENFIKWLEQFINFEREPKKDLLNLQKMQMFADFFGNPQKRFNSIHIAGSKGKGSVSTMIAAILDEAGLKTGLYTSPHIMDFRERVSLSGNFFSDAAYSKAYEAIKSGFSTLMDNNPDFEPTWFEAVTMLAFLLFAQENCSWGVFETGMGGRLDTTNILRPKACVLMPIELEHCMYLGNTIEEIAFEKAGIIKENTPVFCFRQPEAALEIFHRTAEKMQAPFYYMPDVLENPPETLVSTSGLKVNISFNKEHPAGKVFSRNINTDLRLIDKIQAENAAIAACTIKNIFPDMHEATIENGLKKAWLPARLEILQTEPLIIIDGAHTEKSIGLCIDTYASLTNDKFILVFACADDKKTEILAPLFKDKAEKIYITIPGSFKKSNIETAYSDFYNTYNRSNIKLIKNTDFKEVILEAFKEGRKLHRPVLVTGSFYLAAEAKNCFNELSHTRYL